MSIINVCKQVLASVDYLLDHSKKIPVVYLNAHTCDQCWIELKCYIVKQICRDRIFIYGKYIGEMEFGAKSERF